MHIGLPPQGIVLHGLQPSQAQPYAQLAYAQLAPTFSQPNPAAQPSGPAVKHELSEREQRALKRKQANRDSARRSKLRKKQEIEELGKKEACLSAEYEQLRKAFVNARLRVMELKQNNTTLRQQLQAALSDLKGC
mmetsp:Transcript_39478/g.87814  ORF Transcript_39478/g.87814 Transcript_39478/m.87814 type:complete len:135 (+) Transcript_39478:195-599(+)|eukprot:CAMPEP_0202901906 /NCGR_PEP_ID=MMETSP1392-20130828/15274_1 /ASSEMBLY_ACC=CAM_ASM_000868 /TAXON_ID=225041 /ORGANISM="Chlamydomonas chlamydogama, Strain SAG 11-48b" /LENGTH=134 /DNA_ID=CAMNT_0049588559 /DNA_START=195 /DNA_END=599 /DNA_ORIENTATION=+